MQVSIVDLRYRMKSVLRAVDRGESVTVLYRGKEKARLVPSSSNDSGEAIKPSEHAACGIWAGRKDLEDPQAVIRDMRQSRVAALIEAAGSARAKKPAQRKKK